MADLILHHYPQSHFAEKIRRILAYKKLPWRGVEQPFMMPKPDLLPLTGGNRRIPVLQIGADIYCDSALIARHIEALHPTPVCLPPAQAGLIGLIEAWAGQVLMFQVLLPTFVELMPHLPPEFLIDRAAMSPRLSKEAVLSGAPHALEQTDISLNHLEAQLHDGLYLLGQTFSLADASCFYPLWLFKNSPLLFAHIEARPALAAWFARIEAFGAGEMTAMAATEALAIARAAEPAAITATDSIRVNDIGVGDEVAVVADDYGVEESCGTVTRLTAELISIRRRDPALGNLAVHFPRAGYRLRKL
jgi:glutathione S-transferase